MILGPGGQNVYPEDIEFELNRQSGVKDSAVVGIEEDHPIEIHAVLLLENGASPEAILESANQKLASFQKIQNYSVWPEPDFPRSATVKSERKSASLAQKGARGSVNAKSRYHSAHQASWRNL